MDRSTALDLLPAGYAAALRLQEDGASDAAIAHMLGVEVEAVKSLLAIGASKLDKILARDVAPPAPGPAGAGNSRPAADDITT